ncbi:MAG: cytochrome c maturation protein CcmE [Bacteroidetes bacterium]|nr:cytochrome c maturation protein CcmE [Bacteroidota bacterium]
MKNKYIFGGFIIVVFLGIMGYLFTQTNIKYENDFSKIVNNEATVKATGAWVKEKNYFVDNEKHLFSFYMVDDSGVELKVVYKGTIPNNFESSTSVVVTGKFKNGIFQANEILTKCPSKYESQFEENKNS